MLFIGRNRCYWYALDRINQLHTIFRGVKLCYTKVNRKHCQNTQHHWYWSIQQYVLDIGEHLNDLLHWKQASRRMVRMILATQEIVTWQICGILWSWVETYRIFVTLCNAVLQTSGDSARWYLIWWDNKGDGTFFTLAICYDLNKMYAATLEHPKFTVPMQ